LLVSKAEKSDEEFLRHRIDSIRLYRQDREKLIGSLEKKLIIGFDQILCEKELLEAQVLIQN